MYDWLRILCMSNVKFMRTRIFSVIYLQRERDRSGQDLEEFVCLKDSRKSVG